MIKDSNHDQHSHRNISTRQIRENFKNPSNEKHIGLKIAVFGGAIVLLITLGYMFNHLRNRPNKASVPPPVLTNPSTDAAPLPEPEPEATTEPATAGVDFKYQGLNSVYDAGNQYSVFIIEVNDFLHEHFKFERTPGNAAASSYVNYKKRKFGSDMQDQLVFTDPSEFFAITGAMYEDNDKLPPGLLISEGNMIKGLNTNSGAQGNFYMKPNGVFYINKTQADIVTTEDFDQSMDVTFGIQSGPMLIVNNQIPSVFDPYSVNKNKRCAVGVRNSSGKKEIVFVCTKTPVSFYGMAKFMLDEYGCNSALHLESGAFPFIYYPGSTYRNSNKVMNYIVIR